MSILFQQLPRAIEISGREYPIRSDFRDCLRIILAFEDNELTVMEKQLVLIDNLYQECPPKDDLRKALELGLRFLDGGGEGKDEGTSEPAMRLYSFRKDGDFIYSAFQQTHGIDLEAIEYLHWWKFLALFLDLGNETTFCSLVGLRKRVKTGKASKEERQAALQLGDVFDVPEVDTRSLQEKEAEQEFMRLVEIGRQKRKKER
jgi:hypothetical protein